VTATLLDSGAKKHAEADRATIESRLSSGEFFWLDLEEAGPDDFALLRDVFRFHPLALEDSEQFGQRPKLEEYDDYVFLVVYGAAPAPDADRLVEVHIFYSESYLVTVRREHAPACHELRERYTRKPGQAGAADRRPLPPDRQPFGHLLSCARGLRRAHRRCRGRDLPRAQDEHLQEIVRMKRQLNRLRRVVGPQRDVASQLFGGAAVLPGSDAEAERYFRDIFDHLIRVADLIDSYKDLLTGAMDVYLSTVSNRLNLVVERLTVLSTILLPLIVLTGFFGQNFGWLVATSAASRRSFYSVLPCRWPRLGSSSTTCAGSGSFSALRDSAHRAPRRCGLGTTWPRSSATRSSGRPA
jgi:magnesium transporter